MNKETITEYAAKRPLKHNGIYKPRKATQKETKGNPKEIYSSYSYVLEVSCLEKKFIN